MTLKDDRVEQRLRSCGSEFQMWGPKQEKMRNSFQTALYPVTNYKLKVMFLQLPSWWVLLHGMMKRKGSGQMALRGWTLVRGSFSRNDDRKGFKVSSLNRWDRKGFKVSSLNRWDRKGFKVSSLNRWDRKGFG